MNEWSRNTDDRPGEFGRDMVLAKALRALDPASEDPNYWMRFRGWVMNGAAAELARRRLITELTVSDVLTSWARTLVPTAALAAALAGIVLIRSGEAPVEQPIGVEHLLVSDVSTESARVLLSPGDASGVVAFASLEAF